MTYGFTFVLRFLLLTCAVLLTSPLRAQSLAGDWLVYEGRDGSRLVVTLTPKGSGQAELWLTERMEAVPYGEGSQFWGTFRATGGYYFIVKATMSESIHVAQTDSTLTVSRRSKPTVSVKAWVDEAYSTRNLSDYGDYKNQVVAQWKRDFPNNHNVRKGKLEMQEYFTGFYHDAFEVLLEGRYSIVEKTDSTMSLKNLDLDIPLMKWERMSN